MPDGQFALMSQILAAPSPIGLEGAMTYGVLKPHFETFMPDGWEIHRFKGNAGIVLDTAPGRDDLPTIMFIGHADKIRFQVRSVAEDGKIFVNSDSFIPGTCIGHEVLLYSEDAENPGNYRVIEGGTLEAIGAIHFASKDVREGKKGITADELYLELQVHGKNKRQQVERTGIRPGDSIILNRKIKRGFSPDTFYGAYLDNGLGCFVVSEMMRILAELGDPKNIRVLGAIATHEEIGRFGSRVLAGVCEPDMVVGIDVSHDWVAAPCYKKKKFPRVSMGGGMTLARGSIVDAYLNSLYQTVCNDLEAPYQIKLVGRDTGTDAMAAFFASIDAACTSIGFPIRNMHTISESGHTGDVLCAVHSSVGLVRHMDNMNGGKGITLADLKSANNKPNLATATPLTGAAMAA